MRLLEPSINVDIFGSVSGATGWSTHSVNFARALNKLTPVSFRAARRPAIRGLFSPLRGPLLRSLQNRDARFTVVVSGDPVVPRKSTRWIVWETTKLPESQIQLCGSTQFLWTPSSWGKENLIKNGIEPTRIAVVPEGVDTVFFRPGKRERGRFRFLMVGKWENRKFTEGLIQAFTKEFKPSEEVELYLHAHNAYLPNFSLKEKFESAGFSISGNIVLGAPCGPSALRKLYQSASCFVLPTRAEGWGLPILESMACGIPAIVTRYSAPTDYVNDENGYLLNVERMVEAYDRDFGISTGLWAEPDVTHLRYLMRSAFHQREQLYEKGRLARLTAEQFTWDESARIALNNIREYMLRGEI